MSTLTHPIKLNPTTITIPRSLPSSSYALKLGLTPHLLIQEPLTSSCSIRRNGDTLFEVTVPVGGVIELEIEVDREGLGKIGGMEMSIMQEIELEETIKSNIINSLRQNAAQLAVEDIRPHGNRTSYIIRPIAASADRSSANAALIPTYQPTAHLDKIGLCLTWYLPNNRDKDSEESQSSNADSMPSRNDIEDVTGVRGYPGSCTGINGQLPVWASNQLQQALDQLFRTNLIRRFPLIFDPDLLQHIRSITKSSTLLDTLTRALALSASHRTDLYMAARPILNSLLAEQDRMAKYKSDEVSNLSRRGKAAKRIKGDTQDEAPESQASSDNQVAITQEVSKEINVKLLSDALSRLGFTDYKARRTRGGRLGYRSIKLSFDGTEASAQAVTSQSELNKKMHQLHLDEQHQFDDFLDDEDEYEHHQPDFEVYDDDDPFLDSEDDNDGFLSSEEEDEFLETDYEDGRMDGVDVLGYPWPDQMGGGVDDWLDQEDDHHLEGGHGLPGYDYDHNFHHFHDQEVQHPNDQLFDQDHLEEYDEFLDSDVEDHPPHHMKDASPLSPHNHHPSEMDISANDHHSDHEDEFLSSDDDDFLNDNDTDDPEITFHHSSPNHPAYIPPVPYLPLIPQYILPRSPQFSLGQAATIISDQTPNQEPEDEDEFLESDNDLESEMGIYSPDQYIPIPNPDPDSNPEPQSEMGIYTANDEFLDSDPELESEIGDYTADHQSSRQQDPSEFSPEPQSEMGVYTADEYFGSRQTSSFLSSSRPNSGDEAFWDDDEEVVYRIPSLPPDDMRHHQYLQENIDDDFLMSDGDDTSTHSNTLVTPHQSEHRQPLHLDGLIDDGGIGRMGIDCSSEQRILGDGRHSFSNMLPFNNEGKLDQAMPA